MSKSKIQKMREVDLLHMEVHKLQEAIECLNRAGLEHHFGTYTLLTTKEAKLAKIEKIWDSIPAIA